MQKLNGIKLKYTSPALTPKKIDINTVYTILYDGNYYILNGTTKIEMTLDMIKIYFSPVDKTWDELLVEKVVTQKELKQIKK